MDSVDSRTDWTVHQAVGMIAVQLSVPVSEAAVRLGEYAEAHDLPLHAVAASVIARELRFT